MRISDWSSDVCSSDLAEGRADPGIVALLRPTCRLAVPREEIALARVDHVRLFIARQKAGPFIFAGARSRQPRIDAGGLRRQRAGLEIGAREIGRAQV